MVEKYEKNMEGTPQSDISLLTRGFGGLRELPNWVWSGQRVSNRHLPDYSIFSIAFS